jgi:hypothetical protein
VKTQWAILFLEDNAQGGQTKKNAFLHLPFEQNNTNKTTKQARRMNNNYFLLCSSTNMF